MNIIKNSKNQKIICVKKQDKTQQVIWELNTKCLLNCKYCYSNRTVDEGLSFERMDELLTMIKRSNIDVIHITGGEPVLSPFLDYILTNLNNRRIYLTTSLVNYDAVEDIIKKHKIESVAVSLDSIDKDINNWLRGSTQKVLNNIHKLLDFKKTYNIKTKIRMHCVISKKNLNHIFELLSWAKNIGIDEVSCQPISINSNNLYYKELNLSHNDLDTLKKIFIKEGEIFNSRYYSSHLKLIDYYLKNSNCYLSGAHNICDFFIDAHGNIWNCPLKKEKRENFEYNKNKNCKIQMQCMTCLKKLKVWENSENDY